MVDLRKRAENTNMCIETTNGRRSVFPSIKFRLREERKRVIRMSKAKYHDIQDHETGMRRFCLIRNTLQCLQREAREEKLARHSAKANNVSSSYLSTSRPRSPFPSCDMEVADVLSAYSHPSPSPITALSDDEDDLPPCKRQRLTAFEEKENEIQKSYEDRLANEVEKQSETDTIGDTRKILREVYENYSGEDLSLSQTSSPSLQYQSEIPHNMPYSSTPTQFNNTFSPIDSNTPTDLSCKKQNTISSNFNDSVNSRSGCTDWSRTYQSYPCSHSAFGSSDLNSVVYQSLITSL